MVKHLEIDNLSLLLHKIHSHTTFVVCGDFIHEWWGLELKFDSERKIFEKFLNFTYQHYLLSKLFAKIR